jgi:RNA 2',3'-cyclic 3'-phosphodiesterase
MHRLFVGLALPPNIAGQLLDLMEEGAPLRWQEEEQLHLTLRFIGEVERPLAEEVAAALGSLSAEPFSLSLAGVGLFSRRRGGALWAGVSPRQPVADLARRVEPRLQGCGLAAETRAFHPHITLARWNGPEPDLQPFLQRHSALRSAEWRVEEFTLFESRLSRHGAHYERVQDYPLARPRG